MLCRHMKKLCRFVVPVAVSCHLSIKYAAVHFMISFCSGIKVSQCSVCSVQARGGIGTSRNFTLPRRIYEDNLLNGLLTW